MQQFLQGLVVSALGEGTGPIEGPSVKIVEATVRRILNRSFLYKGRFTRARESYEDRYAWHFGSWDRVRLDLMRWLACMTVTEPQSYEQPRRPSVPFDLSIRSCLRRWYLHAGHVDDRCQRYNSLHGGSGGGGFQRASIASKPLGSTFEHASISATAGPGVLTNRKSARLVSGHQRIPLDIASSRTVSSSESHR